MNDRVFKIEKGIVIPEKKKKEYKYPTNKLKVGESFLMSEEKNQKAKSTAKTVVYMSKKRYAPKKFECHLTEEGYRIWRTK